ncbi:helix-turn-helix domain-containing protein [Nocardia sp. NPDC050630]|uniref:helix-turn-helix domain-containing protein n=1 Tax=Nocardia sp. NPDC050630 TaxID=3364321 RepID=UPI0037A3466B
MKWNLRLVAANCGIWKASELRRMLAARGLDLSTSKMSGLWSGTPSVLRPEEIDVFCAVLDCTVGDLMIVEPATVAAAADEDHALAAGEQHVNPVMRIAPKPRTGRDLPPR